MKKTRQRRILFTAIIIIAIITIFILTKKQTIQVSPELSRAKTYTAVKDEEKNVEGTQKRVQFDAFFLIDTDGDGNGEAVRGTCNQIGTSAPLYMELKKSEEGIIKNGKITINSDNFYFDTAIVKDEDIKNNYISTNTKEILLNDISNVTQRLIIGNIRSGDYSGENSKTSAIGNDTTKYSVAGDKKNGKNTIVFTGTYVNGEEEVEFTQTVPITVDWYGEVDCKIQTQSDPKYFDNMEEYLKEDGFELQFDVTVEENKNQLIMSNSNISGTIPELNGYKPVSVKISGTNVGYTYDEETGNFTAYRNAIINPNGTVALNAYTSAKDNTKYNTFNFTVIYPQEAYEAMEPNTSSFELVIPVKAVNEGYNNPSTKDGFKNPYISNPAEGTVIANWKKNIGVDEQEASYAVQVGKYVEYPYGRNVVVKNKPLNIYTGKSLQEQDDTYIVQWKVFTGVNGITDGILLKEKDGETDKFRKESTEERIPIGDAVSYAGIYFNGATETLGENGWIRVYNAETDTLIKTFTSKDWNTYTSSNPYKYENAVMHIRVETSKTNELSYLYVNNIKELDDDIITRNYTKEEFDDLGRIYSYLDGCMMNISEETGEITYINKSSVYERAYYVAPISYARLNVKEDTISTHITTEHEILTIETKADGYNMLKWKNGMFLIKIPKEIMLAEINKITPSKENVKISAYDIYEKDGNYFIKILTESEEEDYNITIDCDLTPNPRTGEVTNKFELYAINEAEGEYRGSHSMPDIYDVDEDENITEIINYYDVELKLSPGQSLSTTQIGSNYGDGSNITIAPRVAKTDKNQRTAEINITAMNNYNMDIEDIKILGVIPFEGNKYILTGNDLGSTFTTYINKKGITAITSGLEEYTTIYYSKNESPNQDLEDSPNGWKLAEEITDSEWSEIKTYLIVIDNRYKLLPKHEIEFQYEINLPEGIDYNETSYSEHAVYFKLVTEDDIRYDTSIGSAKLGFMIAKQYDLEIVKYQKNSSKTLEGITFAIKEEGTNESEIKVTNKEGKILVTGLYIERNYILKELKTTNDYVLNGKEIKFTTYTEINDDGTESLYVVYPEDPIPTEKTSMKKVSQMYDEVRADIVLAPNSENREDYKIQIQIDNEVKARLAITKLDENKKALANIKFTLSGEGKDNVLLTTDKSGNINVSGLIPEKEYTLQEIKADGYYIPTNAIKFTLTNDNGEFKLKYTDNNTISSQEVTSEKEIPTINLELQNEKIPKYALQLTKYAKGNGEQDKTLQNAQYIIYGEGISERGKVYSTDEHGIIKIDDLCEYVEDKKDNIKAEYTLKEIYAPSGYAVNSTELKFRAYRENGTLKIEILDGNSVIRKINEEKTNTETGELEIINKQDVNVINSDTDYPIIQIGVEDSEIFSLFKYRNSGSLENPIKTGIEGIRFKITDLDGNYVTGTDGKIVGEWFDKEGYYAVTTDEKGKVSLNLGEGSYKAIEVYADEKYILPAEEEKRTHYFEIGESSAATWDWGKSIKSDGWNYINSITSESDGGLVAVGKFSKYLAPKDIERADGADVNGDGSIDIVSSGDNDGVIISYNEKGNVNWFKTFGGTEDDGLNKIIQTSEGGYIAVGYVSSKTVKYDGITRGDISTTSDETFAGKDGILLKLDKDGNYEWGLRIGEKTDDEIQSVIETSEHNFVVTGKLGKAKAFLSSYSATGEFQWKKERTDTRDLEMIDLVEVSGKIMVAINDQGDTVNNAEIRTYSLSSGSSLQNVDFPKHTKITSLDIMQDGKSVIAGVCTGETLGSRSEYEAKIYKINEDLSYSLIYTLKGDEGEYVSDVKATTDEGILFGGWYYSNNTTGDGGISFEGKTGTADGYVIKLDKDANVVYSSQIYGDGITQITSVAESKNHNILSGGYFNSSTLSATNVSLEEVEGEDESQMTFAIKKGNFDGFVMSEGAVSASGANATKLEIENKVRTFKVTTQVVKTNDVFGGTIDGKTGITLDGVNYTEDGIRYVETVDYMENSKNAIKITPEPGYVISSIKINNKEYIKSSEDDTISKPTIDGTSGKFIIGEAGTITIPIFENMTEDKHIIVQFSNTISNVEVNHYLWKDGKATTDKVAESEILTGKIGTKYSTSPATDADYEVITNEDYYGKDNVPEGLEAEDYYIPDNHAGIYKEGEKQVVNYYYKEKTYTLTVHHYLAGTEEKVPLKGTAVGEVVEDETEPNKKKGDSYTTTQATEDKIDYSIYELVAIPENSEGTIEGNTEVIYYYKIRTQNLRITKVAEENHDMTISGTKFSLYQYVGDGTAKDELINTEKINSDWVLVDNYETPNSGVLRLEELPITSEYRLVETKASEGRLLPKGQWKIEFMVGDYDTTDTSIITVNGQPLKITAIGNPPALSLKENGQLVLPNREIYGLPSSGSLGVKAFYQCGATIAIIGMLLFILVRFKQTRISKIEVDRKSNTIRIKMKKK